MNGASGFAALFVFAAASVLAGCGQKGPLLLPDEAARQEAARRGDTAPGNQARDAAHPGDATPGDATPGADAQENAEDDRPDGR